jgi:hypothetical protein
LVGQPAEESKSTTTKNLRSLTHQQTKTSKQNQKGGRYLGDKMETRTEDLETGLDKYMRKKRGRLNKFRHFDKDWKSIR